MKYQQKHGCGFHNSTVFQMKMPQSGFTHTQCPVPRLPGREKHLFGCSQTEGNKVFKEFTDKLEHEVKAEAQVQ